MFIKFIRLALKVNNVGRSHSFPVDFVETPVDEMDNILNINVNATVHVTRAIVPGMVKRSVILNFSIGSTHRVVKFCRKRGLVISIGSFSGVSVVSPMLATYAGTKSFLSSFSAALAEEVKDKGVDVECLNTYFVVRVNDLIRNGIVPIATFRFPISPKFVNRAR